MRFPDRSPSASRRGLRGPGRAGAWWLAVAVYTALLPGAIVAWRLLADVLGGRAAGWVPACIVALAAAWLIYLGRKRRLSAARWALLAAAGALSVALLLGAELPSKRIHVPEYMLLAWLLHRALGAGGGARHEGAWVALIGLALGAVDETLQGLIASRFFALRDVLVNGGSALAGAMVVAAFTGKRGATAATPRAAILAAGTAAISAAAALTLVQRNLWHGADGLAAPLPLTAIGLVVLAATAAVALWRGPHPAAPRALAAASVAVLVLLSAGAWLKVPFK